MDKNYIGEIGLFELMLEKLEPGVTTTNVKKKKLIMVSW